MSRPLSVLASACAGRGTGPPGAAAIEGEVDESFGQRAFYREALGGDGRGRSGHP